MKESRQNQAWTLAGALAFALTAGIFSNRALARQETRIIDDKGLRDSVASPMPPATAGLAGKPVPTSWFKTPEQHHAEMDLALLSSRRRRALVGRVAVQ